MLSLLRFTLILSAAVALGCQQRNVESSTDRDQRELKELAASEVGGKLLSNRWCTFVNDGGDVKFHGFLRLTFQTTDFLKIEQYTEFAGAPFGKSGDDQEGLWKWDGKDLSLRLDKKGSTKVKVAFGTLPYVDPETNAKTDVPTMTLEGLQSDSNSSNTVFWTCNNDIEKDPIPVTIPTAPEEPDPGTTGAVSN